MGFRGDDREWLRGGGGLGAWDRRVDDEPLAGARDGNGRRNPFFAFGMQRM